MKKASAAGEVRHPLVYVIAYILYRSLQNRIQLFLSISLFNHFSSLSTARARHASAKTKTVYEIQ